MRFIPGLFLVAACGSATSSASGLTDAAPIVADAAPPTTDFTVGGARPTTVYVPDGFDPHVAAPLVILLHGYSASGDLQEVYFQLGPAARTRGILYAHPDGTLDASGKRFWNATDACCDLNHTNIDDDAYLEGLVSEISRTVTVDPRRIYFVGHSNGGFMSYHMACAHADRIAAIVSLAGAMYDDTTQCAATAPVSVVQIHGTADETVAYAGGTLAAPFPSAAKSVAFWATKDGCDATIGTGPMIDLETQLPGAETTQAAYPGCMAGRAVELWTVAGGMHVPHLDPSFAPRVLDWLLAHPKP